MKITRIRELIKIDKDTAHLLFMNGDRGILSRTALADYSGHKIPASKFRKAAVNEDGAFEIPIYLKAKLEDGEDAVIPIEFDPVMIHELAEITNFSPFEYSVLRVLRKKHGLTLEQVAERIGVSKQHLGKIERGEIENVGINTLKRIVEIGLGDTLLFHLF